jgi:hypothetical protein
MSVDRSGGREVLIRRTLDAIADELGDDYNEDDNNGLVASARIQFTHRIEIESGMRFPQIMNWSMRKADRLTTRISNPNNRNSWNS